MNDLGRTDTDRVKSETPWPPIIMLTMVISVIAGGFLLEPKTEEQKLMWLSILGTNNQGELMNPPLEMAGQLLDAEGEQWSADVDVPWKLVIVNRGACAQECQEMADLVSRVHTGTNRLIPDIKRGYLSLGENAGFSEDSLAALGYETLHTTNIDLPSSLSASGVPDLSEGPIMFVMNPLEVVFLYYTTEHEGSGMLEDIEHVIKLAQ